MGEFSHFDENGYPAMSDVGGKSGSFRLAVAESTVSMPEQVLTRLRENGMQTVKGSVFQTAILAGIMAAKKTGDLIPLCHPLGLDNCEIQLDIVGNTDIVITCTASLTAKTGVEMEALVGASIAALTVYDMCKALSHDIVVRETRLMKKKGGKRDFERA